MKINPDTVLTTLDGRPIRDAEADVTFRSVAIAALLTEGREPLPEDKKWARFKLADKVEKANGELELSLEEAMEIQVSTQAAYGVLVYGRVRQLLNGD